MKTELNTSISIQANKLDLAVSYTARLQHRKAICATANITVTANTIALWLKERMKHIKQWSLLVQQKRPYKSCSSIHLWNDAPIFILVFSQVRSNSFFLHCFSFQSSYFSPWTWTMAAHFRLFSAIVYSLSFSRNLSDQVRAGTAPVQGRGAAAVLIGCVDPGVEDSCKSNYSHWVEPQTLDFYTADIIMTILANITNKKLQTTALSWVGTGKFSSAFALFGSTLIPVPVTLWPIEGGLEEVTLLHCYKLSSLGKGK